jgi:hypothetical protein
MLSTWTGEQNSRRETLLEYVGGGYMAKLLQKGPRLSDWRKEKSVNPSQRNRKNADCSANMQRYRLKQCFDPVPSDLYTDTNQEKG